MLLSVLLLYMFWRENVGLFNLYSRVTSSTLCVLWYTLWTQIEDKSNLIHTWIYLSMMVVPTKAIALIITHEIVKRLRRWVGGGLTYFLVILSPVLIRWHLAGSDGLLIIVFSFSSSSSSLSSLTLPSCVVSLHSSSPGLVLATV